MDRKYIEATANDLRASNPILQEVIRFIKDFVSSPNAPTVAANAAVSYRALITAFAAQGLMEVEWAPGLVIQIKEEEFELSIDGQNPTQSSHRVSPTPSSTESTGSSQHAPLFSTKIQTLLDAFHSRCLLGTIDGHSQSQIAVLSTLHDRSSDVDMSSLGGSTIVWQHIHKIHQLERQQESLSLATNWAYYNLGLTYHVFLEVVISPTITPKLMTLQKHRGGLPSNVHPRTMVASAFQALCQQAPPDFELLRQRDPSVADKSDKAATSRLKKQLQRGRKFLALSNALGTEVLGFVPEICVTRVDTVKLSELEKLKEGSMEKIRVREILSAMELCTREHVAV